MIFELRIEDTAAGTPPVLTTLCNTWAVAIERIPCPAASPRICGYTIRLDAMQRM